MATAFPTVFPIKLRSGAFTRSSASRGPAARNRIFAGRLYSRRALDVRARLVTQRQVHGQRVELVVHGRTVDLSRSGMGLTLTGDLPVGAEVVLSLQLPGSPASPFFACGDGSDGPLCLRAVIVRRRGFRAGLKFIEPTAEQRLRLCQFCYA